MFGMGTTELFIILIIVLVLFGSKKIPDLLGGLGKGIRSFKKGMNEDDSAETHAKKIDSSKNSSDS